MMDLPYIEATVRYLTTAEGGRKSGVASGYRGQFSYDGDDSDGIHSFPDFEEGAFIPLGETVRTRIAFPPDRWELRHSKGIVEGMSFDVREGRRVVARGVVTAIFGDVEDRS